MNQTGLETKTMKKSIELDTKTVEEIRKRIIDKWEQCNHIPKHVFPDSETKNSKIN